MRTTIRRTDGEPLVAMTDSAVGRSACNGAPRHRSCTGNTGIAPRRWPLGNSFVLTVARRVCYGSRLSSWPALAPSTKQNDKPIPNIFGWFCHELSLARVILYLSPVISLHAQTYS